jgi:DNA repair protein RecN (Recombination protein N)
LLTYLKVSDLALLDSVEIEFRAGLNVLTGETGAGKTVLIGAIGLLLGDRADPAMVRTGAEEAVLEACFDLFAQPVVSESLKGLGYLDDGEDELILGRRLSKGAKSRCTVNGRLSPVSALTAIGDVLLEVHGQNTHQALLKQSTHIGYLDRFAGAAQSETLKEYREAYARLRSLLSERNRMAGEGHPEADGETDLLRHEIDEIDSADFEPAEIETLEEQAARMRHSSELWELSARVEGALRDDALQSAATDLLGRAASDMSRMAGKDPAVGPLAARAESLAIEAADLSADVAAYRETLDLDPSRLQQVESRLNVLRELCRKYGGSLDAAAEYRARAAERLEWISGLARRAQALEAEIAMSGKETIELARALSERRSRASGDLVRAVEQQMGMLELSRAAFGVEVTSKELPGDLGPGGLDSVEFLFSPQPSEPLKPLKKIASGGEMSRVMLALKMVLAEADMLPVLVFDEIDAGIGGETATAIGERLHDLTAYHQVLCVTHLPQIASYADWQYSVSRDGGASGASTEVALVEGDDRVSEICRMLGDSSSRDATAGHARDLLERAHRR